MQDPDEKSSWPSTEELKFEIRSHDWVDLTAPSKEECVARIEDLFLWLARTSIPRSEREHLRLALREMTTNAMEWGNNYDASRKVRVSYCLFEEKVVFKIEDEGEGFDPDEVFDPSDSHELGAEMRQEENKRWGGYGLMMVRKIMDDVIFSTKGNVVILSRYLDNSRGAPRGAEPPSISSRGAPRGAEPPSISSRGAPRGAEPPSANPGRQP